MNDKHINEYEAPTLYNEAGEPLIASHGFRVVKYADHIAKVAELERELKQLKEKQ
jgi:hypothetical protein